MLYDEYTSPAVATKTCLARCFRRLPSRPCFPRVAGGLAVLRARPQHLEVLRPEVLLQERQRERERSRAARVVPGGTSPRKHP